MVQVFVSAVLVLDPAAQVLVSAALGMGPAVQVFVAAVQIILEMLETGCL